MAKPSPSNAARITSRDVRTVVSIPLISERKAENTVATVVDANMF
jgi:hypothetical protein